MASMSSQSPSTSPSRSSSDGGIGASVGAISFGGEIAALSSDPAQGTDGMKKLTVMNGTLMPSDDISHVITESFKRVMNHHGFSWKLVPEEHKLAYFQQFKKFYYWDKDLKDDIVYELWHTKAGDRYIDLLHKIKRKMNDKIPPPFIPIQEWTAWKQYWSRDEVQTKAIKAQNNRMTEPNGEGTLIVKHGDGSRSALEYAMEMPKARGVEIPQVQLDVFKRYHVNEDGEYIDPKSRNIGMQAEDNFQTLSQLVPDTDEVPKVDRTEILKQVLGGHSKKKRLFGADSLSQSFMSNSSGSSVDSTATSRIDQVVIHEYNQKLIKVEEMLQRERHQRMEYEEKMEAQRRKYEEKIEARMRALNETQKQILEQVRAQHEAFQRFISGLGSTNGTGHPPS